MIHCKECGEEISKSAKVCPKCGKKLNNSGLRVVVGILALIIIGGVIAGTSSDTTTTSTTASNSNNSSSILSNLTKDRFTLVSSEMSNDSFSCYIEGTIKNNTDKTYSYVQVTFNIFDANGNQLGTAVDNINNFQANGTWKYKAIGLTTEKVAKYEFVEITGW